MLSMARGMTQLWTRGEPITGLGPGFDMVGSGTFWGVPIIIWIILVLAATFTQVSRRTRFGRYLYAVGGNERAAALSGVNVSRVKLTAYTLCGLLAAVAGLILTARLNSATVVAGETYELDAIAAVVIGGTSLSGGRGSIPGTVLGCLIIGVLNNGLFLLEVPSALQLVVKGAVILVAVAVDKIYEKTD
jgi:ribose transport system permease protein